MSYKNIVYDHLRSNPKVINSSKKSYKITMKNHSIDKINASPK